MPFLSGVRVRFSPVSVSVSVTVTESETFTSSWSFLKTSPPGLLLSASVYSTMRGGSSRMTLSWILPCTSRRCPVTDSMSAPDCATHYYSVQITSQWSRLKSKVGCDRSSMHNSERAIPPHTCRQPSSSNQSRSSAVSGAKPTFILE